MGGGLFLQGMLISSGLSLLTRVRFPVVAALFLLVYELDGASSRTFDFQVEGNLKKPKIRSDIDESTSTSLTPLTARSRTNFNGNVGASSNKIPFRV